MEEQLPPHVQRMVEEREQLKIKVDKITDFLLTEKYKELSPPERDMLAIQLSAMATYYGALTIRLRIAGLNID